MKYGRVFFEFRKRAPIFVDLDLYISGLIAKKNAMHYLGSDLATPTISFCSTNLFSQYTKVLTNMPMNAHPYDYL